MMFEKKTFFSLNSHFFLRRLLSFNMFTDKWLDLFYIIHNTYAMALWICDRLIRSLISDLSYSLIISTINSVISSNQNFKLNITMYRVDRIIKLLLNLWMEWVSVTRKVIQYIEYAMHASLAIDFVQTIWKRSKKELTM